MNRFQPIIRIHHVKLRVRDLDRSVAFYRNVLGLEATGRSDRLVRQLVARDGVAGEHFGIVLSQWSQQELAPHTLDHISLEVPTYGDVIDVYERARAMDGCATAPRYYEGYWQTFIFDPDGHKLEILTTADGPIEMRQEQPQCEAGRVPAL